VEVVCCSDEFDFNLNRAIIIIIIIMSPARNLLSSTLPYTQPSANNAPVSSKLNPFVSG
jgi:hypothetical protein